MKNKHDEKRKQVSSSYAEKITKNTEEKNGCCGNITSENVKFAGYSDNALKNIPEDVSSSTFGCGNPVSFSGISPGDTVIDLGSGAGLDLLLASEKTGEGGHVIGIDMTDAMISKARENIKKSGKKNIEVRKGIIEEMPVDDNSVDWIISNCVINLSPEKERVFSEMARVLRPGGKFSISDIMADDLPEWVRENQVFYNSCISGAISEKEYITGLKKAGFENITVEDRLIYDLSQLKGLMLEETEDGCSCGCSEGISKELGERFISEVQGKIASLRIVGMKPKSN